MIWDIFSLARSTGVMMCIMLNTLMSIKVLLFLPPLDQQAIVHKLRYGLDGGQLYEFSYLLDRYNIYQIDFETVSYDNILILIWDRSPHAN